MSTISFSQLARKLDLPRSRADWLLKHGFFKPLSRVGRTLVFNESDVPIYREKLAMANKPPFMANSGNSLSSAE